jgi:hypothetical protein
MSRSVDVSARDRRTLEVRQHFALPHQRDGTTSYETRLWLYFPRGFGISPQTFTADAVYKDAHTYMRMHAPTLRLRDFADLEHPTNPAAILRRQMPKLVEVEAPTAAALDTLAKTLGAELVDAVTTTTLATGVASFTWAALEYFVRRKASVLGFCSGAVAGLVVVTPACGFIDSTSAMWVGLLAGAVPFLACTKLKALLKYDDALDTFGVHAVGGTLGALLTGFFATASVNGNLNTNLKDIVGKSLWIEQLKAMAFTVVLSVVATVVIAFVIKAVIGLRPTVESEQEGLDLSDHGEEGYIYEAKS